MLRIAFIDHAYHRVTKSADFFVDLLRTRFDVTVYYAGIQSEDMVGDILMADFDIVVLWQTEYLAPVFIAAKQRTVCIPMYDGTGGAPEHFWTHMRQARLISFCQTMHRRLVSLGLNSLPVQYMKDPATFAPVADYTMPRAVFWQRLPEQGLTSARVRAMLGPDVHLHVHNAPDTVSPEHYPAHGADTVSYFDLDHNVLAQEMDQANIFVASRHNEGIGMGLLEAMARGMVVIAHDAPTHDEYITHGVNGLLTNLSVAQGTDWPMDLTTGQSPAPVPGDTDPATSYAATEATLRAATQAALIAARGPQPTNPRSPEAGHIALPDPVLPAGYTLPDIDDISQNMRRIGLAARARAEAIHVAWLAGQSDLLDFIEETPRPTGMRLSARTRGTIARDTEIWLRDPQVVLQRMSRWEARGIVLTDRQQMPRGERRSLLRRRNPTYRALRWSASQLVRLIRKLKQIRRAIRTRL
jgi:hypothetical protein